MVRRLCRQGRWPRRAPSTRRLGTTRRPGLFALYRARRDAIRPAGRRCPAAAGTARPTPTAATARRNSADSAQDSSRDAPPPGDDRSLGLLFGLVATIGQGRRSAGRARRRTRDGEGRAGPVEGLGAKAKTSRSGSHGRGLHAVRGGCDGVVVAIDPETGATAGAPAEGRWPPVRRRRRAGYREHQRRPVITQHDGGAHAGRRSAARVRHPGRRRSRRREYGRWPLRRAECSGRQRAWTRRADAPTRRGTGPPGDAVLAGSIPKPLPHL